MRSIVALFVFVAGFVVTTPRAIPKLETACTRDTDCVILSDEVEDHPPSTYACCPGCTQRAGNATWYRQFQAACAASPAPQCPPIGCAMPVVRAACVANRCQIAQTK